MASDSDVEAYLNQLSKKTYSLKHDTRTLGYSSPRPTSTVDRAFDDELTSSNESDSSVRKDKLCSPIHRKGIDSDSNIATPNKQQKDHGHKQTYDKISNLEKKYIKNFRPSNDVTDVHNYNNSLLRHKAMISSDKQAHFNELSKLTVRQVNIDSMQVPDRRKPQLVSITSSVDEELAQYLNETSLTDELDGKFQDAAAVTKNHSFTEECNTINELINFDNILTVDDVLGQMTDSEDKAYHNHVSVRCENKIAGNSKNLVNDESEAAKEYNIIASDKTAQFIETKNTNTLQAKLSETIKDDLTQNSKQAESHAGNERERNILLNFRESFFYSGTQQDEADSQSQPVGVLLAQTKSDIFHSSRRNSKIEFKREDIIKSKILKCHIKNKNKVMQNVSSEESVVESMATSIKSNSVESVVESDHRTISRMDQHVENAVTSDCESRTGVNWTGEKIQSNKSRSSSETEQSLPIKAVTKKCLQNHNLETKYIKRQSSLLHNWQDSSHQSSICDSRDISDNEGSIKYKQPRSKTSKHAKKYKQHHSKRKKARTPASSSSSDSENSDSELNQRRRHHSRHNKHKSKPADNPWFGLPYMQLWPNHHQQYAASTGIFAHYPSPLVAEGLFGMCGMVGVHDLMQQQVALTRQFLDSQQKLHQAYSATLSSSHRYTSLRSTEKGKRSQRSTREFMHTPIQPLTLVPEPQIIHFCQQPTTIHLRPCISTLFTITDIHQQPQFKYIKMKKKPPLTFSDAYKLVKEEMKASEE
nr:peptidyl-prolyl cis-trans isomerase 1-like isoform X2 [Cherax quadricarinatus]XP_053646401.1 peptidyl-prolyl cis-trans isomerase 1-like isoform X2 [Cherax quadricarinatus]XP_053646409.1 peptidyl-prolyl cis-trans isomerase 1-like isoform X2 [Cherax quadricarinatus]XP_053646420.1 peptidyl-prolyl cis-trans isomerase 1-like isoform X2 [Cherax quadricarinatus]XP_053646429.1 peptidyl-prolyl cis-trans isomerase 1-like isoform X2 [Cherax quadricarinatus]